MEIKFRAWWPENETLLHSEKFGQKVLNNSLEVFFRHVAELKLDTIMQFTGLLDKNGKEIYCGDIVKKCKHYWEVYGGYEDAITFRTKDGFKFQEVNCKNGKVIGNIWENPNLIK